MSEPACACHTRTDEVQNLLLPRVPGAKNVNSAEQDTAGRLLKQLLCYSSNNCLWAVTGSSMAVFWVQLGLIPANGISMLLHGEVLHLPAMHKKDAIDLVLNHLLGEQYVGVKHRKFSHGVLIDVALVTLHVDLRPAP